MFQRAKNTPSRTLTPSHNIIREFSTSNCSDINMYSLGNQIGWGAYAVVKLGTHNPSGEKVAIKQYERSKLMDI